MIEATVVMPIHNRFKFVDKSISSVYNQNFKRYRLVIIDDCSSLNFQESEFGKKWIDLFENSESELIISRNQFNLGSGLSRQNGLNLAVGEYIAFLDSDDLWSADFLELCIKMHKAYPRLNATYVTSYYLNGELRNKTNIEFTKICETLIKEYRVWQTGSLLWKRKYISKWEPLSSNQDSLFEFNSGLINDNIKLCKGPNLFINKETGYHTFDRVKKSSNIVNQLIVYFHYLDKINRLPYSLKLRYKLKIISIISNLKRIQYAKKNNFKFDIGYINKVRVEYKFNVSNFILGSSKFSSVIIDLKLLIYKILNSLFVKVFKI